MPHTETMLESKEIFNGRVIRVTLDTVRLENGNTSTREVVHHHGGACILPVDDQGNVYMVRQFRYAMGEEIWELPAGKLEAGEDPFEAAKRELGGIACMMGGFPNQSLMFDTPEQIRDKVKEIIDIMAPGGGYMFGMSASIDHAPRANMEALFDAIQQYGKA